jgi:hypothetical protein
MYTSSLGALGQAPYSPSEQYGSAAPNTMANIQAYCNALKAAQYGTALPFPSASSIGVDCTTLTQVTAPGKTVIAPNLPGQLTPLGVLTQPSSLIIIGLVGVMLLGIMTNDQTLTWLGAIGAAGFFALGSAFQGM